MKIVVVDASLVNAQSKWMMAQLNKSEISSRVTKLEPRMVKLPK
jgi:hypothetical protein